MTKKALKKKYDDLFVHAEYLERVVQQQDEMIEFIYSQITEILKTKRGDLK